MPAQFSSGSGWARDSLNLLADLEQVHEPMPWNKALAALRLLARSDVEQGRVAR